MQADDGNTKIRLDECGNEIKGAIDKIYFTNQPFDKINMNELFFSNQNTEKETETKKEQGVPCIILSPDLYNQYKEMKQLAESYERSAQEYFCEINDKEQGELNAAKAAALREAINIITKGRLVLNDE